MKKNRDKQKEAPDLSSLLVFGYACKLFRDDEKALSLETGSHLIPWMGDSSIKIDRYDGRGHLYHLGGDEGEDSMGELERHEEELCEEERWRALHNDETELAINQEEVAKRAENSKAQFGFNYDEVNSKNVVGDEESGVTTFGPEYNENEVEEEEPYKATPDLMLPPMMTTPPTVKLFSVMEKTALFLADQGPQMEILLKAKQAGNPVFEFLGMEHHLHPFYRHLVGLVKSKQYKRKEITPPPISLVPQYSDLPSLAPRLTIPTIQYKKNEDCAYSKLINKIRSVAPQTPAPPPPSVPTPTPPVPPPPTDVKTPQPPPSQPSQQSGPIVIPPPATQTIVDKMASYVARNGRSFEEVVRSKDEARFSFLAPGDVHHLYYLHKLAIYTTGKYDPSVSVEPVTFTVKKTEKVSVVGQETQGAVVSALQQDNSDSDTEETANDDGEGGSESALETVKVVSNDKQKKSSFPSLVGFLPPVSTGSSLPPPVLVAEPKLYQEEEESKEKKEQAEKERRKREETNKLRDKLAAKAKEKMVQAAKEKALQLERKRKAAEFLAQLAEKKTTVSSVARVDGEGGDSSAEEGELLDNDQEQLGRGTNSCHGPDDTITAVNIWPPPAPPQLVIPTLSTQPAVKNEENSDDGEERRRRKKRKRSRSKESTRSRHKKKRSRSRHKKHKKYKKSKREQSLGGVSSGEEEGEFNHRERRRRKASSSEREEKKARRSVERGEKRTRRRSVERKEKQARRRSVYLSSDSEPDSRLMKKTGDQSTMLSSRENSQAKIRSLERSRESSQDNEVTVIEDTRVQSKEGTPEVKLAPSKPIEEMIQPALNKMTEDLRAKVRAMLQGSNT